TEDPSRQHATARHAEAIAHRDRRKPGGELPCEDALAVAGRGLEKDNVRPRLLDATEELRSNDDLVDGGPVHDRGHVLAVRGQRPAPSAARVTRASRLRHGGPL